MDDEAADSEAANGDGDGDGEAGCEEAVSGAEPAVVQRKEREAEADGEVVDRYETEGAKAPEKEGVGEAGQRTFSDDLRLAENLPEKLLEAGGEWGQGEAGVFASGSDECRDV